MRKNLLFLLVIPVLIAFNNCSDYVKEGSSPAKIFHVNIISEPSGAGVWWRVSSKTDEVNATPPFFLGYTPVKGTRSLNIPGLTRENSKEVEIIIEVKHPTDRKNNKAQTFIYNTQSLLDDSGISINVEW